MYRPYRLRQFVRVKDGPLQGMTGKVEGYRDDGKVMVRMTAWGRIAAMDPRRLRDELPSPPISAASWRFLARDVEAA